MQAFISSVLGCADDKIVSDFPKGGLDENGLLRGGGLGAAAEDLEEDAGFLGMPGPDHVRDKGWGDVRMAVLEDHLMAQHTVPLELEQDLALRVH